MSARLREFIGESENPLTPYSQLLLYAKELKAFVNLSIGDGTFKISAINLRSEQNYVFCRISWLSDKEYLNKNRIMDFFRYCDEYTKVFSNYTEF